MRLSGKKLVGKRLGQFLGWASLTLLIFGIVCYLAIQFDKYWVVPLHFFTAFCCFLGFLFSGGRELVDSTSVRKKAGFGAALSFYSILFFFIIGGVNYLGYKNIFFRYDSTESKVFSLAPQTLDILSKLESPVKARAFYVGGVVPVLQTKNLLEQLDREFDNFTVEVIDPEKKPLQVEKFGVSENATIVFSYEEPSVDKQVRIVRGIDEQSIVNGIVRLQRGEGKTVYYLAGHGEPNLSDQTEAGFLFLKEAIEGENIKLNKLLMSANTGVPDDANALIIASPTSGLLAEERKHLLSYLDRGGKAIFLLDPRGPNDVYSFLRKYGIVVGEDTVIEPGLANREGPALGVRPRVDTYADHAMNQGFSESTVFDVATSVRIKKHSKQKDKLTELLFTSKESWGETNQDLLYGELSAADLTDQDFKGPLPLAVAFEDTKTRLLVFGDSDFVNNANIRLLFNRDLFLNGLNWVLGQEDKVTIRARTLRNSLSGITANQFNLMFVLTVILIPEAIVLFGFYFWWSRTQ